MFITPISGINQLTELANQMNVNETTSGDSTFKNILSGLIENVKQTDQVSQDDILKIAQGNADDLHTITINSEKAELATLTLVQVRNKILDSYNELMRITL
ncbi:MAG: flagellar hook-basal body complex protein FliE [Oscillospiraceae bacterium]|nr:flagellar hook-basal body complex protein FliE [Oscillospiraceae bacterium]